MMPRFLPILVLFAFLLTAAPSKAQSLWSTAPPTKEGTCGYEEHRGETVLSCVTINASAVEMAAKSDGSVTLDLPVGDRLVPVSDLHTSVSQNGAVTLTGRVEDASFRTFIVSTVDETAAGSFYIGTDRYELRPVASGGSALLAVDPAQRRISTDDVVFAPQSPRAMTRPRAGKRVVAQVDLLLLWDDAILNTNGSSGLAALEANFVAYLNQTVANGGNSDIVFNVVHSEVVSHNESQFTDMGDDLTALADGADGILDDAHTLRVQHGADLVHLMLPTYKDGTCGIAYQSFSGANLAFGVTGVDGCGNDTFAHEIGHNLGMGHDQYVSNEPQDAYQLWSYGYVDLNAAVHTVMAYDNECFDNGINCTALPYFSDPAASSNGVSLGIADQPPMKSANNYRTLLETAENRATYSDIVESCLADVYNGETGPSSAAQGEPLNFSVVMAKSSLSGNCTSDPSFAIYLTGANLDTYFVGRQRISLTETPQAYGISGTPSNPTPPTGTYSVLLFDDAGGGYYTLDMQVDITAGSGVATEDEAVPSSYGLVSAYPNPFNPQARVAFTVGGQEPISIRVLDTLGRVRAELLRGAVLSTGEHTVTLEAANLPSGTYFVRMEAGRWADTLPVTLLR